VLWIAAVVAGVTAITRRQSLANRVNLNGAVVLVIRIQMLSVL